MSDTNSSDDKQASMGHDDLTASMEDYLEAIFWLSQQNGVARVSQIAKRLSVNMSSVSGALRHLSDKGYIDYDPYQFIKLNAQGEKVAREVAWRHEVLKRFLCEILDVDETLSGETACKLEHHIDKDVLDRLLTFIGFVSDQGDGLQSWAEMFTKYRKEACDKCNAPAELKQEN